MEAEKWTPNEITTTLHNLAYDLEQGTCTLSDALVTMAHITYWIAQYSGDFIFWTDINE